MLKADVAWRGASLLAGIALGAVAAVAIQKNLSAELRRQTDALRRIERQIAELDEHMSTALSRSDGKCVGTQVLTQVGVAHAVEEALNQRKLKDEAEKKTPPAPTAESIAAFNEGAQAVDAGIAARAWTERDAEKMRRILRHTTPSQRDIIMQRINVALNNGQMRAAGLQGAPY